MSKENLPIIGLIAAVLMFFSSGKPPGPPPPTADAWDAASQQQREGVADVLVSMKDEDKTGQVADAMSAAFERERKEAFEAVKLELLSLWYNGQAEEAAARLRERRTTGVTEDITDD